MDWDESIHGFDVRVGGVRLCIGRTPPMRRTDSPYAHVTSNQWTCLRLP